MNDLEIRIATLERQVEALLNRVYLLEQRQPELPPKADADDLEKRVEDHLVQAESRLSNMINSSEARVAEQVAALQVLRRPE